MIVQTHRLIGEYLYDVMQKDRSLSIKLSRRRFVYGNVLPDIVSDYKKYSHYYHKNHNYVFGLLKKLVTEPYSDDKFSEDLGILMHFFADYTCVYHACEYLSQEVSISSHIKYEAKFHFYAMRELKSKPLPKALLPFNSLDDIEYYVDKLTKRHNVAPYIVSVADDFRDLLELTTSTLYYILREREKRQI
ncbi:MAG TPA: hypothetical protein DCY20_10660 [Firmicutes bacterium]|nr:hypothetical protein [Bacillota bacterium]